MVHVAHSHRHILQYFYVILVEVVRIACNVSGGTVLDDFRMLVSEPVPNALALACGSEFNLR
jgi:hypothetical protein